MNTNINIRKYKDITSFKRRIAHNNRVKSINKEDKVCKNILYKKYDKNEIEQIKQNELSRSQISNKISKLKYKYKQAKKEKTKESILKKIEDLEILREKTQKKNHSQKINFIDISFSITRGEEFVKDKVFNEFLKKEVDSFISKTFPNLKVLNIVGHLDQSSPHIHISGQFYNGSSISQDLKSSFGEALGYSKLQKAFNEHIQASELKYLYNLNIDTITGKTTTNALKLEEYKKTNLQEQAKRETINLKEKVFNKNTKTGMFNETIDKDQIIKTLLSQIYTMKNEILKLRVIPKKFLHIEKENKSLKAKNLEFAKNGNKIINYVENLKNKISNLEKENKSLTNDNNILHKSNFELENKLFKRTKKNSEFELII